MSPLIVTAGDNNNRRAKAIAAAISMAAILVATALISGLSLSGMSSMQQVSAQSMMGGGTTGGGSMMSGGGAGGDIMSMLSQFAANHKFGLISSIQNDVEGRPAWVVAGHWMMEMGSQNNTGMSNTTTSGISNVRDFHAMLFMVRLNGSAMHTHEISNFTEIGSPIFDSSTNSTTITGTATITMREGPVPNVPTTIQIVQDKVIAISPDPAAVQNHFGDTPIRGIVISPQMIQEMMTMMMSHGNMTGMMMPGPMMGMMQRPTNGGM